MPRGTFVVVPPTTITEAMQQARDALLERIPAVAKTSGLTSLTSPGGESMGLAPNALAQVYQDAQLAEAAARPASGGIQFSRAVLRRR